MCVPTVWIHLYVYTFKHNQSHLALLWISKLTRRQSPSYFPPPAKSQNLERWHTMDMPSCLSAHECKKMALRTPMIIRPAGVWVMQASPTRPTWSAKKGRLFERRVTLESEPVRSAQKRRCNATRPLEP